MSGQTRKQQKTVHTVQKKRDGEDPSLNPESPADEGMSGRKTTLPNSPKCRAEILYEMTSAGKLALEDKSVTPLPRS